MQNSSPILRWTFLARKSAKLIANFSATRVASLPSLSLSRRAHLTHNIGSASALPILCVRCARCVWERERERYRDRRKWCHHCCAKIGDEFTLSLAKNSHNSDEFTLSLAKKSHFLFLPSHFPTLTIVALKFAMSSHFPLPKNFALFVPTLSNGASCAMSDRKPKTNDQIQPSPILFFPLKKWIKLIPKTIGNRKRDCAWGRSGW